MADLKSTGEILQESIYKWLWKDFQAFSVALTPEQRVDLDGKLWALSGKLAQAGMWQSLQDTFGIARAAART
jgi:hypothetical protein